MKKRDAMRGVTLLGLCIVTQYLSHLPSRSWLPGRLSLGRESS